MERSGLAVMTRGGMAIAGIALCLSAGCSKEAAPPAPSAAPVGEPVRLPPNRGGFPERADAAGRRLLSGDSGGDPARLVRSLAAYSHDPDPQLSDRATEFLVQYVRAGVARETAVAFWDATDAILEHGHPEAIPILHEVIGSRVEKWAREMALSRLAQVQKGECLPLLRKSLHDPLLRAAAAVAIGQVARGSGDAAILELLGKEGEAVQDPEVLACIARALREVGGNAVRPILAPWIDRLTGWNRTDAAWFVHRIDPLHAIRRLVELKVLPEMPEEGLLSRAMAQSEDSPGPASGGIVKAAFSLTAGSLIVNAHGEDLPIRYDRLLEGFTTAKRGLFVPQGIRQAREGKGDYTVHFVHHGRPYRFTARDLGDWYDLGAVVETVNRALADDDIPERFVGLHNGAQVAALVVAVPDRVREAAKELYLALEPDPDGARKLWMEYQGTASVKPGK